MQCERSNEEEKKSSEGEEQKVEENYQSDSSVSVDFKEEVDEINDDGLDPDTNTKPKEILGPRYLRQVTHNRQI